MIEVKLRWDEGGQPAAFVVSGHSEYGPPGRDIVCAGVSAIVQTIALALDRKGAVAAGRAEKGMLDVRLREDLTPEQRHDARTLVEAMILGLLEIQKLHPDRVRVTYEMRE